MPSSSSPPETPAVPSRPSPTRPSPPGTFAEAAALLPAARIVAILAAVAEILDDAHHRGVSHGRLTADDVLVGSDDHPVVVGLAEREPATGGRPPASFDPAEDVLAIGQLAALVLACGSPNGRVRTHLAAVASAARHPDAGVRPPMAELARVLRHAGAVDPLVAPARERSRPWWRSWPRSPGTAPPGEPTLPPVPEPPSAEPLDAPDPDPPADDGRHRAPGSPVVVLLGVAALAAVVTSLALVLTGGSAPVDADGSSSAVGSPPTAAASAVPSTGAAPATPSTTIAPPAVLTTTPAPQQPATPAGWPPAGCPATAESLAAAGLPAVCAGAVGAHANELHVGSLRFVLGDPADQVSVVDADCSGTLVPILLEHLTGSLYVFDGWSGPGRDLTGRRVAEISDAVAFATPATTCGEIAVRRRDGTIATVPPTVGS